MKRLLLLLFPLALASETTDFEMPKQKQSFSYFGIGGTVLSVNPQFLSYWMDEIGALPVAADFTYGRRKFFGNHAWDLLVGAALIRGVYFPWPYGQTSYLYYPTPQEGIYFGAGLTLIPAPFFLLPNIPLTVGYQIKDPEHPQFIQFQFAAVTQSATISYGMGF